MHLSPAHTYIQGSKHDSFQTKVRFNCLFFGINDTFRNQKQVVFSFQLWTKQEITNMARFLVFLFVLTKQMDHSLFRFHWWAGLRHPIASDWLSVLYQLYLCCALQNKGSRVRLGL